MKRDEAMDEAKRIITKDRNNTHGKPEHTFSRIAEYWSTYLGMKIQPHDVAALQALMKIARIGGNPFHEDNWIDGAGYMGCGIELATEEPIDYELVDDAEFATSAFSFTIAPPTDIMHGNSSDTTWVKLHSEPPNYDVGDPEYYTIGDHYASGGSEGGSIEDSLGGRLSHYKAMRKKWTDLPAPSIVQSYRIWKKEGEITHEPRWFIGVKTHIDKWADIYNEFYLHGYDAWLFEDGDED